MISNEKINQIIKLKLTGYSVRSISRICGCSQATAKKYAAITPDNEDGLKRLNSAEIIVRQWIYNDRGLPRKQRHTASRIYDRLIEEYGIYTYMEEVKRMVKKIYAELNVREDIIDDEIITPGSAQYGAARIYFIDKDGKRKQGTIYCLCFPYSGAFYAKLTTNEYPETALQILKEFFYKIGKVPYQISFTDNTGLFKRHYASYDYPSCEAFYCLKTYYHYNVKFILSQCAPLTSVENACRTIKRDFLKIRSKESYPIHSIKLFNNTLQEFTCQRRINKTAFGNIKQFELHQRDKEFMGNLPEKELPIFTESIMTTSRQNSVMIDNYKYFLTPRYIMAKIIVKKFSDKIEFFTSNYSYITSLKRQDFNYNGTDNIDWINYLPYLIRTPNAIKNTTLLLYMPEKLQELFKSEDNSLICEYMTAASKLRKSYSLEKIFFLLEKAYLNNISS
jgi:hypothetical protein